MGDRSPAVTASPYNASFYETVMDPSARDSAEHLLPILFDLTSIKSVVDVGCGTGGWLECFHRHGISDLLGVEGDWVKGPTPSGITIINADLAQPLLLDRTFDLVLSLEVAEHLPATSAEHFVRSLTRLGDVVCFSAAIPLQGGVHHVNEQWPDYWAALFGRFGYAPIDCVRPRLWNNSKVAWWYAQNIVVYASERAMLAESRLRELAGLTDTVRLSLVHPRCYLAKIEDVAAQTYLRPDASKFSLGDFLKLAPAVVAHGLRRRLSRHKADNAAV